MMDLCSSVSCHPNGCKRALGPSAKGGGHQSRGGSLVTGVESCCFLGYRGLGQKLWEEGDGDKKSCRRTPACLKIRLNWSHAITKSSFSVNFMGFHHM